MKIDFDVDIDMANRDDFLKLVEILKLVLSLFEHKEIVEQLFHISNHFDIIQKHPPTSIEQLAMILAMIRPGKRHLVGKSWKVVEDNVWIKPNDGTYFFKKSHSYGYALAIIVQLNLLCED